MAIQKPDIAIMVDTLIGTDEDFKNIQKLLKADYEVETIGGKYIWLKRKEKDA
jgi:hypothetical protein